MEENTVTAFIVFATVLIVGGLYWWARKSTKYPDYAARKEAEIDAMLESLKKYVPDQVDAVITRVQRVDAVTAGQTLYKLIEQRLNTMEAKLNELLSRIPK